MVAPTYNTDYSGGKDQEDHSSLPVWEKISETSPQQQQKI
jgi:hypothetical protein